MLIKEEEASRDWDLTCKTELDDTLPRMGCLSECVLEQLLPGEHSPVILAEHLDWKGVKCKETIVSVMDCFVYSILAFVSKEEATEKHVAIGTLLLLLLIHHIWR